MMQEEVLAWAEKVIIPTYGIGKPEKNPIFLEKRVYQGSSGAVYPHPVVEKILDEKTDVEYTAVFIENEYLKIMVLPQLGGRVQRAYDKVQQRDFIYYNQVIKPALVGLTGPWISGGIEFNWPQHHRPSTFEPMDYAITEHNDGSKTIWVNEVELMTRTKGMAGFTLYPGRAYLEVNVKLYNRSFLPQTFLWWANPAVKVNDHYQSVFPPDVHAVFDHGKRDVSDFPIATGTYYKVDYSPGTDISRYKNIPVPTSFMAVESKYDFIGCYEHDTQAGMLHVADHHVVPGKKQWTWGKGDFGVAWDRNLTDEDGPYIELMCGAYTDNQPDFSWLQPNEEKSFAQYFMPYAKIGMVKNATKDAAINLETDGNVVSIKVYATALYPTASIELMADEQVLDQFVTNLSPANIFEQSVTLQQPYNDTALYVEVKDKEGHLLVSYRPEPAINKPVPPPAVAAKLPAEIESNELLFLNGLHLEQYRHATFSAPDYYLEALRRDPNDARCNNAMGLWLLRRGQFEKAAPYFSAAIQRLTLRNPNPYDGEAYYHLGVCLRFLGRKQDAYDAFFKSAWNDAWQHSAYLQLARIATEEKKFTDALHLVEKSILRNYHSLNARHLKAAILRKLGRTEASLAFATDSLTIDQFNYGCSFEALLILQQSGKPVDAEDARLQMKSLMRNAFNTYAEFALDYMHAGLYEDAIALLDIYSDDNSSENVNPMLFYYKAYCLQKLNDKNGANDLFRKAATAKPDYCFPGKIEEVNILREAILCEPTDAKAHYYLGNFWYANGQFDEAISCWEHSIKLNDRFPTVLRNISLAYHNKRKDVKKAIACLEKAFDLDRSDARVLMELDQLYKLYNYSPQQRLNTLASYLPLVEQRDDLYLEHIVLYNQLGEYKRASELLAARKFHPWEGGEGKTVGQFLLCHIELAKQALKEGRSEAALDLLAKAEHYPENLGEGRLHGAQENDLFYLQGLALEKLVLTEKAEQKFLAATKGISEPVQAIFYNDPQPDKIVYQGLAWLKLGNDKKAAAIFNRLIEFGDQHLNDNIKIDYFAVSLPDLLVFDQNLDIKNRIHCYYLKGLGNLGLGNHADAKTLLDRVLELDVNHQGAIVHKQMINFLRHEKVSA